MGLFFRVSSDNDLDRAVGPSRSQLKAATNEGFRQPGFGRDGLYRSSVATDLTTIARELDGQQPARGAATSGQQ